MTRTRKERRRQPQKGQFGWRSYETMAGADTAGKRYIASCRPDYRPQAFYVLTQHEGGHLTHYPILVLHDPEAKRLHARSGFRILG